jgi:hypothetical protein
MNITCEQVISQVNDIETAIRHGLREQNIQAVMKEKRKAIVSSWHESDKLTLTHPQKTLFGWQKEVLMPDVQAVFQADTLLQNFTLPPVFL